MVFFESEQGITVADSRGAVLSTGATVDSPDWSRLLSCREPGREYADLDVQSEVDALRGRAIAVGATGVATLETYTVTYDYDHAPLAGFVAALLDDGRRAFAATREREPAARLLAEDPLGARVRLLDGARFELP